MKNPFNNIYLKYKRKNYHGLCGLTEVVECFGVSGGENYAYFSMGIVPSRVLNLIGPHTDLQDSSKREYDAFHGNFNFIDWLFKYATYALLLVMIGFAIGYILAGPHVLDFIINLLEK